MRRIALVAAVAGAALLVGVGLPPSALADPSDDAVTALKDSAIYVGADHPKIDRTKLGGAVLGDVKVAILPSGGPDATAVAKSIGERLDAGGAGLTVLVFEGNRYGAASSSHCGAGSAIDDAVSRNRKALQSTDDVTTTVAAFGASMKQEPRSSGGCGASGIGAGGSPTTAADNKSDGGGASHTGLIIVLLVVAGIVGWLVHRSRSRRRRAERELSDARAQVMPYYERLVNEVNTIKPGDNATARQAMADASERLTSAKGQLGRADSLEKYAQVGRTALEGLYAARSARSSLGLDPGPPLPPVANAAGEHLSRPQEVTVQGQTFQGYPSYMPGAPYYYGGGYGVPGGWYGVPFWETLLVGSMLGGAFGGFGGWGGGWGGYDAGYGTGYDAGYNAGEDAGEDSGNGGGWGDSGGGGSWGDGGGWGDSGGGGSWGDSGGGGDFGGSGDSGGSW